MNHIYDPICVGWTLDNQYNANSFLMHPTVSSAKRIIIFILKDDLIVSPIFLLHKYCIEIKMCAEIQLPTFEVGLERLQSSFYWIGGGSNQPKQIQF